MSNNENEWLDRLRAAANANPEFTTGSEWLDLRLLLRIGATACWLKVYRGRAIDAMPYTVAGNRLGYDVVVSGAEDAWRRIVDGSSSFGRENAMGMLLVDGHRTEGDKSYRALVALADRVLRACGMPPSAC